MNSSMQSVARIGNPTATLIGAILVVAALTSLAGCGGGSASGTTTTPPTTTAPAVTLSASSLTFTSGVGVATTNSVTITNSGTASLTFSGFVVSGTGFTNPPTNTCGTGIAASGTCTVTVTFTPATTTTVTGSLTITDNASNSPQSVSLSGTGTSATISTGTLNFSGVTSGTTSTSQPVMLNNLGSTALSITSITASANFSETNNCGTSVAAGASCTINVTFAPTTSGTISGTLTIIDGAGTQTVTLSGSTSVSNTAVVSVNFGPNGPGPVNATSSPYYDGIFTSVNICAPGSTTNCTTVTNVLVDTGSVGLRVLSTALSGVTLPQINDSATGYPIYECVQFADLSYTFGPMQMATVQVGGETASQLPGGTANAGIPIQVIAAGVTPPSSIGVYGDSTGTPYDNPCLYSGTTPTGGTNADTVAALGSNGILGVGNYPQDCGVDCETLANTSGQYLICATGSTGIACDIPNPGVTLAEQIWNPVSAFPLDNNGVSITLPTVPALGQATATGTLTFGIGTGSNNAVPGGAQVYGLDNYGSFASASYNGVTFCTAGATGCATGSGSGGTFIDSGSNGFYVSDETTLGPTGITDCLISSTDIGLYCPSSPVNLTLGLAGSNGTSTSVSLPIANALNLFAASTVSGNLTFAAFNNVGGPSCIPATGFPCNASTDSWDIGLPFFFGRTVFVGIAGATTGTPNLTSGYWAF